MKRLKARYGCPVELSLDLLGGKWKPVLLARLKESPLRYGELRSLVPGLSDKVLTQRLKDLQRAGLIRPRSRGRNSVYALTARGDSLRPVLQGLYDWGQSMAAVHGVELDSGEASAKQSRRALV